MRFAFSDGSPLYELAAFLVLFGAMALLARLPMVQDMARRFAESVTHLVRRRRALPENGLESDLRKIDVTRIAVGTIAALRYGDILLSGIQAGNGATIALAGAATLAAGLVAVGLWTQIAALVLMASANIVVDNYLGASTLGTMVMSMVLAVFVLAPAGRTLSVDAVLARRRERRGAPEGLLTRIGGEVGEERLILAKLAGVLAYYCVCLYSVAWHIHDDAWLSGYVIGWVLLSPASNPAYSGLAWQAYELSPWLYVNFARLSIAGMFAWYVLVLPGLFMGPLVRAFVILWGLSFFLISTFILPLSYLGWYELCLWFLLFATGPGFGRRARARTVVLFDEARNRARLKARLLRHLDLFARLEFRGRPEFEVADHHSDDLVLVDPRTGATASGTALQLRVAKELVLLWPVLPLIWLTSRLGGRKPLQAFLEYVVRAAKRVYPSAVLFDAKAARAGLSRGDGLRAGALATGLALTLCVLSAAFVVRLPILNLTPDESALGSWSKRVFAAAPTAFGIHKINVFNTQDLSVFTFRNSMFLADPDFAFAVDESAAGTLRPVPPLRFRLTDTQRYGIAGHSRRMARMNLGCDRDYWETVLPLLRQAFVNPPGHDPIGEVVFERQITTWPTKTDFGSYARLTRENRPLCRAWLDLANGQVKDFAFLQPGIDEAMRRRDYEPVLDSRGFEAVLGYACAEDGRFLHAIAGGRPDLRDDSGLAGALASVLQSKYGRFEVDCLMEVHALTRSWPQLLSPAEATADATACDAGILLLDKLRAAAKRVPEAAVDAPLAEAREAAAAGDFSACVASALAGRAAYWGAVTKPAEPRVAAS